MYAALTYFRSPTIDAKMSDAKKAKNVNARSLH